jgi:DNA-binding NarL/FixJ family response regulator
MSHFPRILTLDPTGVMPRLVRAVLDLSEQSIIQTDVPSVETALNELERGSYDVVVSSLELYSDMDGMTLATKVQTSLPDTRFIVVGGAEIEPSFDTHVVLLGRPLDPQVFLAALIAGANGDSMMPKALADTTNAASHDYGSVPSLNLSGISSIIDTLMADLSPLGLLLLTREGEVLLERGTDKRLDRDEVTQALLPTMTTTIQMGALVGGKIANMNFYDGDRYDIFALGVGYHHLLCLVFDGKYGTKQLGAVRNYALRAAQDMIALLGSQAYVVQTPSRNGRNRSRAARAAVVQEIAPVKAVVVEAAQAKPVVMNGAEALAPAAVNGRERVTLDPIINFDPSLFDQLQALDTSDAEDIFDLDAMAAMAKEVGTGNLVSGDDAFKRGIVGE